MDSQRRIEVYIRQRGLQAPLLEGASERCQPSFWWAAQRLTRRQRRRWLKKYLSPSNGLAQVPF